MHRGVACGLWTLLIAAVPFVASAQVSIQVESLVGHAGDELVLEVSLTTGGAAVAGTQNQLQFPDAVALVACAANDAIGKEATLFSFGPDGCQPGVDCRSLRALVFSLENATVVPDGAILYSCTIRLDAQAPLGDSVIGCSEALASAADATVLPADCPAATLRVEALPEATIRVGGAAGPPGGSATFDVALETSTTVVATQNDLHFPAPVHVRSCAANPAIGKDSTRLALLPAGCTRGVDCTTVRALVFSLADATPIPTGSVLYGCTVNIDAGVALMTMLPIVCAEALSSAADGAEIATACTDGVITVAEPNTPPCAGDCNEDLFVSIDELVIGINVLLARVPLAECAAVDENDNGRVGVNELVSAVDNALHGCP
jgi:hypothetical protein